jgi:hypothetical protein
VNRSPVGVKVVDALPANQGYALFDNESKMISVVKGVESKELFFALATEFAHAAIAERDDFYDRSANHETALFAAYVVAGRYGVNNSEQMPVFTLRAEENATAEIRGELSRIRDAAKTVGDHIEGNLDKSRTQESTSRAKEASRGDRDAR